MSLKPEGALLQVHEATVWQLVLLSAHTHILTLSSVEGRVVHGSLCDEDIRMFLTFNMMCSCPSLAQVGGGGVPAHVCVGKDVFVFCYQDQASVVIVCVNDIICWCVLVTGGLMNPSCIHRGGGGCELLTINKASADPAAAADVTFSSSAQ